MQGKYLSLAPLVCWRSSPRPLDLGTLFGRQAPVVLEIGFGNGEFLVRTASAEREKDFLGIDLEWKSVRRALRRAAQEKLTNLRVMQGDARQMVEWSLSSDCLSQVTILFPCPWPKRRHERHRLFSVEFLGLLRHRLKPDGGIWIVTDFEPLFQQIQANAPAAGYKIQTRTVPASLNTKYERRWTSEGQQEFFESWLYPEGPAPPAPRPAEVPVRTYVVKEFPDRWNLPETVAEGAFRVQFRDLVFDRERQKAMVRVFVVEEPLHQDLWIELTPSEGAWHLRPAPGCVFYPTRGVQRALDALHQTFDRSCRR
jgi:tRNA (guanine-N7-)-methyltransferase